MATSRTTSRIVSPQGPSAGNMKPPPPFPKDVPVHVEDEPIFPDHDELDSTGFHEPLVPGSRFHDEQWVMAAEMLARGASFLAVSRAIGCGRTTLWRAYYRSTAFRRRVWWERQQLNKEAELRLGSVRAMAVEQLERLVSQGDPATVRWVCDRMGVFGPKVAEKRAPATRDRGDVAETGAHVPAPAPAPAPMGEPAAEPEEEPRFSGADLAELEALSDDRNLSMDDVTEGDPTPDDFLIDDDDRVPGAMRERFPPPPEQMAKVATLYETRGTKGAYPWTANPEVEYPSLGSRRERAGHGAFER